MHKLYITKLYDKFLDFSKFKGYIISVCDESIIDLPNVTLKHQEFLLGDEYLLKEKRIHVIVSCFMDIHSKHILTIKLVKTTVNEIDLAI